MKSIYCTTCGVQYRKSKDFNHRITNRQLAASREYYCQHCKKTTHLAYKKTI